MMKRKRHMRKGAIRRVRWLAVIAAVLGLAVMMPGCDGHDDDEGSTRTMTSSISETEDRRPSETISSETEPSPDPETSAVPETEDTTADETVPEDGPTPVTLEGRGERLEAEYGEYDGVKLLTEADGYSGDGYLGFFEDTGNFVDVRVKVREDSVWDLSIGYLLPEASGMKINSIYRDGTLVTAHTFEPGDGFLKTKVGPVYLEAGEHTLRFMKGENDWGWMAVDYFELSPSTSTDHVQYDVNDHLIDKQATEETVRLYRYLREQYGKKVISGQQLYFEDEKEIDRLEELTGKKPAMKGYDLINQTEGGPVDDQPERAIRWVEDEGGILTLCWHWWAPSGGRAFYTEDTTFDVREAVKEGTEEHKLILRDIDAIAPILLDMQDRGIPVIWRPLHEASGGWFWWGAHGPEPYQTLWKILYRRLVEYHGVHNLIWVANAQDRDWYVGHPWCDIIGEDIYAEKHQYSAYLPRYLEAYNTVKGKKIVALTENGVLPSMDEMRQTGAMWAWFMPWWGEFTETDHYTEDEVFVATYQDPDVITLEDLPEDLYREPLLTPDTENRYDPFELVENMHPGWNMGNTFDASNGETSWGNPRVTEALIRTIRDEGFRSIRIPVTWAHAMGPAPDYTIDPDYLARVQEVVDWALDAGLYVMVNMHHDSDWLREMPEDSVRLGERFEAAWRQIAEAFKDYPDELLLEAINEPRFSEDWGKETDAYFDAVDRLNTIAYRTIRRSGGNNAHRMIVMETLVADITETKVQRLRANIKAKQDPYIIASAHYYGPYFFSVNAVGQTLFDDEVIDDIEQHIGILHDELIADGIPVILGEYGLLGFDTSTDVIRHGEMLKFFDYLLATCKDLGITTIWWDNGQHLDREALTWRLPELHATIMQGVRGRSSQTAFDAIYVRENPPEPPHTTLILNGNRLESVETADGRTLTEGEDYVTEGAKLIFPLSSLDTLLGTAPGSITPLTLHFDDGPDWALTLRRLGDPHVEEVALEPTGPEIRLALEGDEVRRLAATDAEGRNLGYDDWTEYLQNAKEFEVRDDGTVWLKGPVAEAAKEGPVDLLIELWSGETLDVELEP